MRKQVERILQRFSRDEQGNIFILFGLTLVPLLVIMGGAVDLSRYNHYKVQLSNAVDAAGLALVRKEQERGEEYTNAEAKQFVVDYVDAMRVSDETFHVEPANFTVTKTENGYAVDVTGTLDNLFLPLAELRSIEKTMDTTDIGIDAEFVRSAQNIELAMVLDVTGSMGGSKIEDLEDAAEGLIDIIVQPPEKQNFYYSKVAVVPYSMGVNLGDAADEARGDVEEANDITDATWTIGDSVDISEINRWDPARVTAYGHGFSNGDTVYIEGVRRMTRLNNRAYKISDVSTNTFRLKTLSGRDIDGDDYSNKNGYDGTVTKCGTSNCDTAVKAVGHGFSTGDYVYITDMDEPDHIDNEVWQVTRYNDNWIILNDSGPGEDEYEPGGKAWCTELGCQYYRFENPYGSERVHEVSTCVSERSGAEAYTDAAPSGNPVGWNYPSSGNRCLSNEVMPLTSSIPDLKAKVGDLTAQGSTAGQIGIAWGWYMVSPNFNSLWSNSANHAAAYGAPYTIKVVVLMTDGQFNTPYCEGVIAEDATSGSGSTSDHIGCDSTNGDPYDQSEDLCDAMKAEGVIVYTVGFDIAGNEDAEDIMEYCASKPEYVYLPSSGTELKDAFAAIAEDVNTLRIAR